LTCPDGVSALAWSPDGKRLATACLDFRIYLWDAETGHRQAVLEGPNAFITSLALNHAENLLASSSWEGLIRLWSPDNGRQVGSHPGGSWQLQFSADDRFLLGWQNVAHYGRLELADKGTIFLDEIGELPIESQSKLLRVLQEHEFERLGGTRTLLADIRVIAATNRNLRQMMDEKQFRSDLYYRLRVFPITVPPLRERRDDVPILVRFFTEKYARRMGRKITSISEPAMKALCDWHWPGNIREMENFIERAVILSQGEVLDVPVDELKEPTNTNLERGDTLEATEREYILQILKDAGGVVAGPRGAAAKLGLKRSTLQGKMRKLGISLENL